MDDRKEDQNDEEIKPEMMAWGLISDEGYTPEDHLQTVELINVLRDDYDQFESKARSALREEVLGTLLKIVKYVFLHNLAVFGLPMGL